MVNLMYIGNVLSLDYFVVSNSNKGKKTPIGHNS